MGLILCLLALALTACDCGRTGYSGHDNAPRSRNMTPVP